MIQFISICSKQISFGPLFVGVRSDYKSLKSPPSTVGLKQRTYLFWFAFSWFVFLPIVSLRSKIWRREGKYNVVKMFNRNICLFTLCRIFTLAKEKCKKRLKKRCINDSKTIQKQCKNDPKTTLKRCKNAGVATNVFGSFFIYLE